MGEVAEVGQEIPREDGLRGQILAYAHQRAGEPIRAGDLLHMGSRASVDQALSRLAKGGRLRRTGRGAYVGVQLPDGLRPEGERGSSKRNQIVAAASELFASRGYYGVSMRDIAEPSGLHIATLYHYFEDKRALYEAVVEAAWEEGARRTLCSVDATLSPRQQLEVWIRNVLEFHYLKSTSARIRDRELFFDEETGKPPTGNMLRASAQNEAVVTRLLEQMNPPILRSMPAARVVGLIYALSYGTIRFRPAHKFINPEAGGFDYETTVADVLQFVGAALGLDDPAG